MFGRYSRVLLLLILALLTGCKQSWQSPPTQFSNPPTIDPATAQPTPQPIATELQPTLPAPTIWSETPTNALPTPPPDGLYSGPVGVRTGEQTAPEDWKTWPVLPVFSQRAQQIYDWGIAHGRDPARFSKIGDCQSIPQYFIGCFDDPGEYNLGPYEQLLPTIEQFAGSWDRRSKAVRTGFNVASVLTEINADPAECLPGEIPLECEFRLHNPSFALISMETWTADRPTNTYQDYLRSIVEICIANGVLPIVSTKADNLEGDHSINRMVAQVAADYDIPLWNWWAVAHTLPNGGLLEDGFHLTNGPNNFGNSSAMENAWPNRNLSALELIASVWYQLGQH
jgi:hypothetical protein